MSTIPPSPSMPPVQPEPTYLPQSAGTLPYAPPQYDVERRESPLALIAFIGSFFVGLVGIVCGHIALAQLKKTGEHGYGFALAGVIIGYITTAFGLLVSALVVVSLIAGATAAARSIGTAAHSTHSTQNPAVSQADVTAVTDASTALTTSIDSIASTMIDSPASAREALNTAEEAFKSGTSAIGDETLQGDVHYVNDDLTYLSSDLADYAAGGEGSTTASQLKTDVSTLKDDLATLQADCR